MESYFALDYSGAPFRLFGASHILTLVAMAIAGWIWTRSGVRSGVEVRPVMRRAMALVLLANELSWHAWNLAHGAWEIQIMLPLHLCAIMVWITVCSLWFDIRRLYPAIYFLGIAGAVQALITPDAGIYGFPHFRFFQTLIAHAGLVAAGIWVALVEGYRPSRRDVWEIFLGLNVYAVLVGLVNTAIGSNYLYVTGKPAVPSVMDYFPEWPWYLPILELMVLVALALLYWPLARNRSKART